MFAKKSLGQNFLMHQRIADRIADSAHLTPTTTVLEIGPGTGMLTRSLLERAGKVVAVEADASLIPGLQETFADAIAKRELVLVSGDIRTFDLGTVPSPYTVVANIPYYITGEIIRTLLSATKKPQQVTLLVQKEVAIRIAREKKESILSLSVKVYGMPHYEFTVPRGAFHPAPNVDSAVLSISDITSPFASMVEEKRFFDIVHAAFAHKRKRLAKNLEEVASTGSIKEAFQALSLDENVRAEDISIETWKELATRI